jgi:hypothetical protein
MVNGRGAGGAAALALWAVASCSGSSQDIATGPLSGRIGGKPWTLVAAETDSFLSTPDELSVTMYGETVAPCAGTAPSSDALILGVPSAPGDYALGLSRSATFYIADRNQNLVTDYGRLRVDAVTATAITGGANIQFDNDSTVSGQFQVTICP